MPAALPQHPEELPQVAPDEVPDAEREAYVRLLRGMCGHAITAVSLGASVPHLIITLDSESVLLVNGHHSQFECWELSEAGPEWQWAVVALPGDRVGTVRRGGMRSSPVSRFRARIHLLRMDEGGRHHGVRSGYRTNFYFGLHTPAGEKLYNDATLVLEGVEVLQPGESAYATVVPLYPEIVGGVLQIGLEFDINEGGRLVGRGIVLDIP
jgi:hypothetical protein